MRDTGGPIAVPVGDVVLGHVFNLMGDALDLKGQPLPVEVLGEGEIRVGDPVELLDLPR